MSTKKIISILIGTGLLLGLSTPAYAQRMCSVNSECAQEGAPCISKAGAVETCRAIFGNPTPFCVCSNPPQPKPNPVVIDELSGGEVNQSTIDGLPLTEPYCRPSYLNI